MAIDTASKRASALGVGLAFVLLVVPSGTIGQPQQQTIGNCYSGILASPPPPPDNPDCIVAFDGILDPTLAVESELNATLAENGLLDTTATAMIGELDDVLPVNGLLTPILALEGILCKD